MTMKKLSALCLTGALMASTSAMAWESEDGSWSTSASVALSTEYVWRGVSQTMSDPAISGSFDVGHATGLYAGVWGSNVDFGSDASAEIDYYAGFSSDIGDTGFSYDIGGLYYDYPSEEELNFFEVYGSVSYSFLSAGIAYSLDWFDTEAEDDVYYTLDASYDLAPFSLAAGIGYYDYDAGDDYTNWYLSASTELAGFGLDLTYSDTDEDDSELMESTVILTISKSM
jgi:uncharacterized protein (TIGR02001 family)